jgi:tetratricopeptide (TPR) repeat protein
MHIERALALNPNDADVRAISCFLHTCLGDAIEGIAYGRSAMERNPYYPDWYPWMLSAAYYDAGEYEKALETLAVVSAPNVNMRRIKAMALAQLDRLEEAKREVSEVLRLQPAFSIGQQLKMLPLKQQSTRDHFAEGMRKAGFPE